MTPSLSPREYLFRTGTPPTWPAPRTIFIRPLSSACLFHPRVSCRKRCRRPYRKRLPPCAAPPRASPSPPASSPSRSALSPRTRVPAPGTSAAVRSPAPLADPPRRQFLRHHAPALAYANPLLPIAVRRIPDPRSKDQDPSSPHREAVKLGRWGGVADGLQLGKGNVPGGEMVVEFRMPPFFLPSESR